MAQAMVTSALDDTNMGYVNCSTNSKTDSDTDYDTNPNHDPDTAVEVIPHLDRSPEKWMDSPAIGFVKLGNIVHEIHYTCGLWWAISNPRQYPEIVRRYSKQTFPVPDSTNMTSLATRAKQRAYQSIVKQEMEYSPAPEARILVDLTEAIECELRRPGRNGDPLWKTSSNGRDEVAKGFGTDIGIKLDAGPISVEIVPRGLVVQRKPRPYLVNGNGANAHYNNDPQSIQRVRLTAEKLRQMAESAEQRAKELVATSYC